MRKIKNTIIIIICIFVMSYISYRITLSLNTWKFTVSYLLGVGSLALVLFMDKILNHKMKRKQLMSFKGTGYIKNYKDN